MHTRPRPNWATAGIGSVTARLASKIRGSNGHMSW